MELDARILVERRVLRRESVGGLEGAAGLLGIALLQGSGLRWSKKAKAVHDESGRLVPCDIGVN